MARSRDLFTSSEPRIGTTDATDMTTVGVLGARLVPKRGFGKRGDPVREHPGRRREVGPETSGAQYAVTASRAYPGRAEGLGKNVRLMPCSHSQAGSWRAEFDEQHQGAN